ncbi:hypothetical protein A3C91_01080 [Candidatus Azambacteria bacterium RIFCSPHIGHO2_02_FULL_52_12]|uniref:ABC transporter domain-containing protein n=1 Tax=Candidatus Azambacteria bacterium RIFCSPLOWO2_01_FULL_46_25 TaxID=1797298 RepID=A0A1F5BU26_9BACT|nr:MAG: hypothetical protein A3C91_01080 [Candidatus Azambacteria bacterium RIFCSPHIGHO2_02_FULL_52_12]OGD34111.1 MAG: hypothetical protein A2988_01355 [Candidatus Azambacteria bacterium RIFCSPLOWO2_01_FULL_46_25]OGD36710.1 MAG: hypothetical protein A2850_00310 [Candidatus Azambacteria bacterium RIFCSPHIGHO2_01_FULL_51_74]
MTEKTPLIEVKDLSLIYDIGTPAETLALKKINLKIYPEEYIIFFGPSGCGKSTLLYCISGLLTPTDGGIFTGGKDITKFSSRDMADFHRRGMGIVFQAYNLIQTLSVLDNIALPQLWRGGSAPVRERAAKQQLERFSLSYVADRLPQELSGGQQQRVSIARALVNNPPLMLADEPVGNLDSVASKGVLEIFSELNAIDKKTVVMVTHNSSHFAYADRIIYMKDGQIIKEEVNNHKERPLSAAPLEKGAQELERMQEFADALSDDFLHVSELYLKEKIMSLIVGIIKGDMSLEEFQRILIKPIRDGGIDIGKERAAELMKRLETVMFESRLLKGKNEGELRQVPLSMEIGELRRYMLSEHRKPFAFLQIKRLEEAIGNLVRGIIDEDGFSKVLMLPEALGGVGLTREISSIFLFKMKLVLKLR